MDWIVHNTSEHMVEYVKDTRREKAPSHNSSAYDKYEYEHKGCWYITLRLNL